MKRKVFISFLGTNNYLPTNYIINNQKFDNIRFVQEALVKQLSTNWNPNDLILIFCTEESEKRNWVDGGHKCQETNLPLEGLETRLIALCNQGSLHCNIKKINIPEGFTESEIWQIFRVVYNELYNDDAVYLDITHAFRSIPLFMMVLLNYSSFLKKTSIEGLYYGAFEKLGPAYMVKDLPIEKRNAPVIDLMNFAALMEWTQAAADFSNYGNPNSISKLTTKALSPILSEAKGSDKNAEAIKRLITALPVFVDQMRTNRGIDIYNGEQLDKITSSLTEIKDAVIEPFIPLFEKLKHDIELFANKENILNGFSASFWCYKNGYWQQAITLLFENTITWLSIKLEMDWQNEDDRNLISSTLKLITDKTPQCNWTFKTSLQESKALKLIDNELLISFSEIFKYLRDLRNDINHAGIRNNPCKPQKFQESLKKQMEVIFEKVNFQLPTN